MVWKRLSLIKIRYKMLNIRWKIFTIWFLIFNVSIGGDSMSSFGGYYKGEKKKPKKNLKEKSIQYSSAPTYTMPEIISKKKPSES